MLDRLAVTVGPGTFTGQRVGLSFMRGLRLALNKPLTGVTSLEAMAMAACAQTGMMRAAAIHDARREEAYLAEGCIWVFRVNRAWSRDAAVGGNVARFINHACRPNCWVDIVDRTIWIRASRNIAPGEELTYDYRTEGLRTIPCRCRPGCPNKL